jgi:calmodulin
MPRRLRGPTDQSREDFDAFDKNGDGLVSIAELLKLMGEIGEDLSPAEAGDALRRADTDGDGELSFDEFIAFMLSDG